MESSGIFLEAIGKKGFHMRHFRETRLSYPMHYHPHMELWYCHEGSFRLHLERKVCTVEKGGFALIPPLAVHSFSCESFCSCTYMHIPEEIYLREGAPDVCQLFLADATPPEALVHAFSALCGYVEQRDEQLAYYQSMILLTLCGRQLQGMPGLRESESAPMLRKLLSYIQAHYKEPLTLDILSVEFAISKSALSRMLNSELRSSLPELVNKYRMLEAAQLLSGTRLPITRIACDLGYGSPCGFNRHFQKHFGVSPREYRKNTCEE